MLFLREYTNEVGDSGLREGNNDSEKLHECEKIWTESTTFETG